MVGRHFPSMFRPRALILALLVAGVSHKAPAQWAVSADVTAARFWGGSQEVEGDRAFRPYRPTIVGLGIERQMLGMSVGVRGYYASASLGLEGSEAVVAIHNVLDLHGLSLELSRGITALGEAVNLVIYAGPLIEVWDLADESSSTHAGLSASVGLQVALGGQFSGVLKAGAAVTASSFSTTELEVGFESRALWRREVSGRLRYEL